MPTNPDKPPCLMCGLPAQIESDRISVESGKAPFPSTKTLTCRRCGEYRVSKTLALFPIQPELKPYLSAATRQASERRAPILLEESNLEDIAAPRRLVTISQKVDKALHFVAAKCSRPGFVASIDFDLDYPMADCFSGAELMQYVEFLIEEKSLLKHLPPEDERHPSFYTPTIAGWQAVEPTLPTEGEPDRCFVAMWFDDLMDSVYESGFAPAIAECGFKAYRVKEDPTNKGIADRVLAEIRRARFVIADFTGQRTSVYYEAGFAHGLGREVIGCCREDEANNLTFDTRHLGHIVWKDAADLKQKLADSIRANIIPKR